MRDERSIRKDHYTNQHYLKRERFYSYVEQIELVKKYSAPDDTILEVGKGNGLLAHILKSYFNCKITTLDINPELQPDVVANIAQVGPWKQTSYDIVVAFEVLEHMSWEDARKAVVNLYDVTKKYLIVSIPDMRAFVAGRLSIFERFPLMFHRIISLQRLSHRQSPFGGDHYWEIGIRYNGKLITNRKIRQDLFGKMTIVEDYRCHLVPWHHFYVIQKNNKMPNTW